MAKLRRSIIGILTATVAVVSGTSPGYAGSPSGDTDERFQEALKLRRQVDRFRLHAREFHQDTEKDENKAKQLSTDAERLKAQIDSRSIPGQAGQSDYQSRLKSYLLHARQYQAHLAAYNLQTQNLAQQCRQADIYQNEYQQHCGDYQAHCDKYHHDAAYPHYCPPTIAAHESITKVAQQFQQDELRVRNQEAGLRAQERALHKAEQERLQTEFQLLSKSAGAADADKLQLLKKEYQQLQIEFQKLQRNTDKN